MASSLTWMQMRTMAMQLAARNPSCQLVYGIPTGGIPVAALTGLMMVTPDEPMTPELAKGFGPKMLVVDDLVDSGRTLAPYAEAGVRVDACFRKPHSPPELCPRAKLATGWLTFPWERGTGPEDAVVRLLEWMGDDPTREGLRDTPKRVVRALREMSAGIAADPAHVLGTVFNETTDQMVVVRGIRFASMCEHHLLPFTGTATVGYVPTDRVVGLSKIPRLVEVLSKRPQVQERLTNQIAQTLMDTLKPQGVGVVVKAHHSCMGCRGVRQPDAEMVTSCLLGNMRDDPAARGELLALM